LLTLHTLLLVAVESSLVYSTPVRPPPERFLQSPTNGGKKPYSLAVLQRRSSRPLSLRWYRCGTVMLLHRLNFAGPTRYQWDQEYFLTEIDKRVQLVSQVKVLVRMVTDLEKLAFYDYWFNLCQGRFVPVGPMISEMDSPSLVGSSIVQRW